MTRRCGSSQPTPTRLPCGATKSQQKCYSRKPRKKNEIRKNVAEHTSEWQDPQAPDLSLLQISDLNRAKKWENGNNAKKWKSKTKCESDGVEGGRVKNLSSKTLIGRKNAPERAAYETQLARAAWKSCPTLRWRRRTKRTITRKPPPVKLNQI